MLATQETWSGAGAFQKKLVGTMIVNPIILGEDGS
jgi:hypothetical protein